MAIEIERRFLVQGEKWKKCAIKPQYLRQGYLVTSIKNWTVRIRIRDNKKAWLTLKMPAEGIAMNEFEYLIPITDAEALWKLTKYKITKTRYELNLNQGSWIVDCFEEQNSPLIIAEVELTSLHESVDIPSWCHQEITSIQKFSNAALALNPISHWSIESRIAINLS